jgi:hypothetical protein
LREGCGAVRDSSCAGLEVEKAVIAHRTPKAALRAAGNQKRVDCGEVAASLRPVMELGG